MPTYSDLAGVMDDAFSVKKATLDSSAVVSAQTFAFPATGGTLALTTDVGGTRFIDGGSASSVYLASQSIDGGGASRTVNRVFDGGGA
jgi:hypothetical protein